MFSSRVSPDSYHSTLSLRDNMTVYFLSRATKLFGLHCEPLTATQKFLISPWISYTHTEISDISTGLLHPHRNSGYLPGSLTPTQKFRDIFPGLLHPHRNFRFLHGSLIPTQKFGISSRVSYTHTEISGYLPGSLAPTQKFGIAPQVSYTHIEIRDISSGLLHPHRNSG